MIDPLFTKHGEPDRLAREARLLERARHPGVVELVEWRDDPEPVLVTRRVVGDVLADAPPQTVEAIAGVVASLAATLADLHSMGLVHGAVAPEHILLTPRPVLCGLADGGSAGDPPFPGQAVPGGFTDPLRAAGAHLDPSHDVYALGALIRWMLARVPHAQSRGRIAGQAGPGGRKQGQAGPGGRKQGQAGPGGRKQGPTAALLALSLRASNPDGARRPPAATAAAEIRAAVPQATLAVRPLQAMRPAYRGLNHARWLRRAPLRAAVVSLGVAMTVGVVTVLGGSASSGRSAPTIERTNSRPPSKPDASVCPAIDGRLRADVDGNGCPEALRFADGVLAAGSVRWAIGAGADDVVTGDWDCDGRATLALLDRETGAVYRFDVWPDVAVAAVPLIAQVDGAMELRVKHRSSGACDVLTVARASGAPKVLP